MQSGRRQSPPSFSIGLRQAAAQAVRSFAYEEASRLYRLAFALQNEHFVEQASLRCELLLTLGRVEADLGAAEPSRAAFLEAAQVAREHALTTQFERAAIGFEHANFRAARSGETSAMLLGQALDAHQHNDAMRVELLACLCRAYVYCNRANDAQRTWRTCVRLARELGDSRALYLALTSLTAVEYWPGIPQKRLAAGEEAWSIAACSDILHWTLADLMAYRLCDLMRIGDIAALRATLDADRRVACDMHSLYHQAVVLCFETLISINEGAFARAEQQAGQGLQSGRSRRPKCREGECLLSTPSFRSILTVHGQLILLSLAQAPATASHLNSSSPLSVASSKLTPVLPPTSKRVQRRLTLATNAHSAVPVLSRDQLRFPPPPRRDASETVLGRVRFSAKHLPQRNWQVHGA